MAGDGGNVHTVHYLLASSSWLPKGPEDRALEFSCLLKITVFIRWKGCVMVQILSVPTPKGLLMLLKSSFPVHPGGGKV